MKRIIISAGILLLSIQASAQSSSVAPTKSEFNQWHMLGAADGSAGVGAIRANNELLKGKKASPVVVAIIDSGTETFHEDLRPNIWVNTDEERIMVSTTIKTAMWTMCTAGVLSAVPVEMCR